jgi:hypothetical protein
VLVGELRDLWVAIPARWGLCKEKEDEEKEDDEGTGKKKEKGGCKDGKLLRRKSKWEEEEIENTVYNEGGKGV